MESGLTRDKMIHFVACNVGLRKEAFSYFFLFIHHLFPFPSVFVFVTVFRLYFIKFSRLSVTEFYPLLEYYAALVGSWLQTFRGQPICRVGEGPTTNLHRLTLQKSEGFASFL
jgi:hypothetical protein